VLHTTMEKRNDELCLVGADVIFILELISKI